MRILHWLLIVLVGALLLPARPARADSTTIYRCESPAGISLQSKPCPKGAKQSKRSIQRPVEPIPPASHPVLALTASAPAPVTAAADIPGPNDPYPLWQCMRADGSTFESRDGVPGRQWVVKKTEDANTDAATAENAAPAQIVIPAKGPIVRPYVETAVSGDEPATDPVPPPPGAAPGQWVIDQCTRLEPQQACDRFAARRDALRKQIYAAMPSERVKFAPEEQDLTKMLFATCGR